MSASRRMCLVMSVLGGCVFGPVPLEGLGPPCVAGYAVSEAGTCQRARCAEIGEGDACDGADLVVCREGREIARSTCGCDERTGSARCAFTPGLTPITCEEWAGTSDVDLVVPAGATWDIDSATGDLVDEATGAAPEVAWPRTEQRSQPSVQLPALRIVRLRSLVVEAGATLRVRPGGGARETGEIDVVPALVLIALRRIVIAGRLDASAAGERPGPGAIATCDARCGREGTTQTTSIARGGGGGGARGGDGGAGARSQYCYTACCDDATCSACGACEDGAGGTSGGPTFASEGLVGGGHGGAGGRGAMLVDATTCIGRVFVPPGGGGGAIALMAGSAIVVESGGVIAAHGGGGANGDVDAGGGGGGAGGHIVLEAPIVLFEDGSLVTAQGGAGGTGTICAGHCSAACALSGRAADGRDLGAAQAPDPGMGAGVGGNGSRLATDARGADGLRGQANFASGGGGGGGGRIAVRAFGQVALGATSPTGAFEQVVACAP